MKAYSVKEAADLLGVSEQSIYQKLKRKKYKDAIKPHILKQEGKTFITFEGLEILKNGPDQDDEPEDLAKEVEDLKRELLKAQKEVIEAQKKVVQYAEIIMQLQRQRALEIELKTQEKPQNESIPVTQEKASDGPKKGLIQRFKSLFKR